MRGMRIRFKNIKRTIEQPVGDAPVIYDLDLVSGDIEVMATAGGTAYWLLDTNLLRTGAQVATGGGAASGSFVVASGTNDEAIDISAVTPGSYYLHIVMSNGSSFSSVLTQAVEVEAPPGVGIVQTLSYSNQTFTRYAELQLPATVTAGNTLLAIMVTAQNRTVTAPSGWTLIGSNPHEGGANGGTYVYRKTATGSEGGTKPSWDTGSAARSAFAFYELDLDVGNIEVLFSQTNDPPALTPSVGNRQYTWIAHNSQYGTGARAYTAAPSTYGGMTTARTNTADAPTNAGERTIATAHKQATAASDDPGIFTTAGALPTTIRAALTIAAW